MWILKSWHWPFALLAALGLALLLTNLGSDYLWADEGDTAVLASSIVKFGVPRAWDGVTFTDSDKGARENSDLVMVSHPWAQYYVAAAAFFVLGENTFSARLPFALAGWLTILLVYAFVWQITANRWAAFSAAALIVLSVQFLLYSRQCRNYSLNMLLTCWLFWIFFRMKSARSCVLFALAAILLFHTHPIGIVPVGVLGILTLIYKPFALQRRWFWFALPAIIVFTLPWYTFARGGYAENSEILHSIGQFFGGFTQYLIECASVTPLIGIIILFLIGPLRFRPKSPKEDNRSATKSLPIPKFLEEREAAFLLVTFLTFLCYGLAMAVTQSSNALWYLGLRYTPAMIPLMAMIAGILIAKIGRGKVAIRLPLLLIFGFTTLAQLTPWTFWSEKVALPNRDHFVGAHVPTKTIDLFLGTGQLLFLGDLWHDNPGTVAQTCQFLRQQAKPGDVLITNYCWEPLYFHTRLPQGMKILPNYPVYEAARRKGLPEYVFGVDHVRWVVWRSAWEGYQGYSGAEVGRQIFGQGGRLTKVAEMAETRWENREDIHFRRFSGGRYLFPWPENLSPSGIFRVDWPDDRKTDL
jgi:4-amino-4-deoxy-L-arabinose transferase-like glycosyltransferase